MRTKNIENKRVGKVEVVLRRYAKARGIQIAPSKIYYWRKHNLLDDCIKGKTSGGVFVYDVLKTIKRIDEILLLKKARLSIAEIRRTIKGRIEDELYKYPED